ncbi:conjugal transfer protein TraC [Rothia nasimurium]|uniref:Conjugal transfer protein TraC n=1 Tax=Rothia nasimurium TaxID=85336 RepID=A0A4Y9F3Z2_9MICC|nr:conjugal transfer protein TraC [Rothia nasimurium]MBF0808461.1 conjugal transfer protein TraC [Rothia nasimurium]TFU21953.1 conjugal transfer protein TraC [Rothia nasimurium]
MESTEKKSIVQEREAPQELGILSLELPGQSRELTQAKKQVAKQLQGAFEREVKYKRSHFLPGRRYEKKGAARKHNLRGSLKLSGKKRRMTSFTGAATYPFTASSSFGVPGVCIGQDLSGAGGFFFDPWELYAQGVIKGMNLALFGALGVGKSSLIKSFVCRQVLLGRKAVVMSDRKNEWEIVTKYLDGKSIGIGAGYDNRMNPLDEGNRPSVDPDGNPMTEEKWQDMVRTQRSTLLTSIAEIIKKKELTEAERLVLGTALDKAVRTAQEQGRVPVIPDVVQVLHGMRTQGFDAHLKSREEAVASMHDTFSLMVSSEVAGEGSSSSELAGLFDGESTIKFDVTAPIVSFNTSALVTLSPVAAKIAHACIQGWAEAAITSNDFGKRLVIYEEGLEMLEDIGSINRMVRQYKLARHYGIFNILILHKITDLDVAGDVGSQARAAALSLLGDSEIRIFYRQEDEQKQLLMQEFGITHQEWKKISSFPTGVGLWKLGKHSFEVKNTLTRSELPILNTDKSMAISR